MLAFTSFGVHLDKDLASSRKGVYSFKVKGQVYHDLPALVPNSSGPCYFQLYFHDTMNEIANRLGILKDGSATENMVKQIMKIMENNPYAQSFRSLQNCSSFEDVQIHISADVKLDQRVYNAPKVDQVAAIWIEGNNSHIPIERDIVITSHSGYKHRIKHYYSCYDPLQYPLLFPLGELGWHCRIPKVNAKEHQIPASHSITIPNVGGNYYTFIFVNNI